MLVSYNRIWICKSSEAGVDLYQFPPLMEICQIFPSDFKIHEKGNFTELKP